jgi:ketosteroid isomerase-like protein
MSVQNEIQSIHSLIKAYSDALNSADIKSIGNYYTSDGLLLPNGHRSLSQSELTSTSGERLRSKKFQIDYQIKDISLQGDFAFVESIATVNTINPNGGSSTIITRDLLTLQKNPGGWKIFRYMFNNM